MKVLIGFCVVLLSQILMASDVESFVTLTAKVEQFSASFKQSIRDETNNLREESHGHFVLNKPNQFIWTTKTPYEQSIISDGKTLWVHDVDLDQVNIQTVDKTLGSTPALMLSANAEEIKANFKVKALESGSKTAKVFELEPLKADTAFQRVLLMFKNEIMSEIILYDSLGQQTSVEFSDVKVNTTMKKDQFVFVIPDDIDVIDSRSKQEPKTSSQ